jgi:hypothetical protein
MKYIPPGKNVYLKVSLAAHGTLVDGLRVKYDWSFLVNTTKEITDILTPALTESWVKKNHRQN